MNAVADDRIAKLEARVEQLEAVIAGLRALFGGGPPVASDRELDGPHGDEKVRFDPRDWKGEIHKGRTMSRCAPEFLDIYAETMTYFASRETDPKKAGFDKKTAARAAGWARRLRAGWTPPPAPPAPPFGGRPSLGGLGSSPRTWGAKADSFGNVRSLGLAASPAAEPEAAGEDDSFDFGANVRPPPQPTTVLDEDDEDPPL